MSDQLDFSREAADETISTDQAHAQLKDTESYDTVKHRKERIEKLRDKAVDRGDELRLELASGGIRSPQWRTKEGTEIIDNRKRVARTVYRNTIEAFVREAFQIIAKPDAESELRYDYLNEVEIATVKAPAPKALLKEYKNNLDTQYWREILDGLERSHARGDWDKETTIYGLRDFVELESPMSITHDREPFRKGKHTIVFRPSTYEVISEPSWSELDRVIELTTMALDDVGIGFDFETEDEWNL